MGEKRIMYRLEVVALIVFYEIEGKGWCHSMFFLCHFLRIV